MIDDFNSYALTGWFPGHMFKATRQMSEALKLIDLVVELVDARAPLSSRNPEMRQLLASKPYLIVANKYDLASQGMSKRWEAWFNAQGMAVQFLDSSRPRNVQPILARWRQVVMDERSRRGATRPLLRPIRVLICGVPNVGKSTLVNHLCEHNHVKIGPKPGVTRTNQWIPLGNGVELLDTPGILWPKIQEKKQELLLALLGIFKEELLPQELMASFLAWKLEQTRYPVTWENYGLTQAPADQEQLLNAIAKKRNFLKAGGELDTERAAIHFIKDFRDGKIGRITLEKPPVENELNKEA